MLRSARLVEKLNLRITLLVIISRTLTLTLTFTNVTHVAVLLPAALELDVF